MNGCRKEIAERYRKQIAWEERTSERWRREGEAFHDAGFSPAGHPEKKAWSEREHKRMTKWSKTIRGCMLIITTNDSNSGVFMLHVKPEDKTYRELSAGAKSSWHHLRVLEEAKAFEDNNPLGRLG